MTLAARFCCSSGRATPSRRRRKIAKPRVQRNPAGTHSNSAGRCPNKRGQLCYALRLMTAGAKAIAVNPEEDSGPAGDAERSPPEVDQSPTPAESDRTAVEAESAQAYTTPRAPRVGTKLAKTIEMLRATEGATIGELSQAMGWLPHSTYAVLTSLRKRGYALTLDRSDAERGSAYRIVVDATAAHAGTAPTAIEPPVSDRLTAHRIPPPSPAPATATRRSRATRTPRAA